MICLETKEGSYEHCRAVELNLKESIIIERAESFDEYFNQMMREEVQKIGKSFEAEQNGELEENPFFIGNEIGFHRLWNGEVKSLPIGIGYKRAWIVIQDNHIMVEDIIEKFNYFSKEVIGYFDGMEQANSDSKCISICDFGQGEIYILGSVATYFIYHKDELEKFSKGLEKVTLFFTNRVSESHGFAVVNGGKIRRLYYYEDSEIFPICFLGEPLEEEIKLGLKLQNENNVMRIDLEEADETILNEDMIINLAMELTGREREFSYKKVVLLRLGLLKE